jgi:hypothetical protein
LENEAINDGTDASRGAIATSNNCGLSPMALFPKA